MLQYLIIQLDDTSVSYCHYENSKEHSKLIGLEDLKSAILFAMKENLMIQFLYPNYELPQEYKEVIHSIDHIVYCFLCVVNCNGIKFTGINAKGTASANIMIDSNLIIFKTNSLKHTFV